MQKATRHLLLAAATLLGATHAHAGLVLNGSFENTVFADPWVQTSSIQGWTSSLAGGQAFELQKGALQGGVAGFAPKAADGIQYLELNTTGFTSISQTLATTANSSYSLSFAYAGRSDTPDGASSAMDVYWNNTKLTATPVVGQATGSWTYFTLTGLIATSNETVLRFSSVGPASAASYGSYLDAVSVSAVPEPVSLALILLGLAGIGMSRRRR